MTTVQNRSLAEEVARARTAFWIGLVVFSATTLVLVLSVAQDIGSGSSPLTLANAVILVPILGGVGGMIFGRPGSSLWATISINASILIGVMLGVLIIEGLGLVMGVAAILIVVFTSGLALPPRYASRMIILGVVGGMATILLDLFGSASRDDSGLATELPFILGGMVLAFVALLARQFSRLPLRAKLVASFLFISLSPVLGVVTLNNYFSEQALVTNANQALLVSAAQAARTLDNFFTAQLDSLGSEALLPEFLEYLALPETARAGSVEEGRVRTVLLQLSRKAPLFISSYALLDAQGLDVADTFAQDIGIDKSDRNYFQEPFQSGLAYLSPVEVSPTAGDLSLYFAVPVRDVNGKIIGVLRVRYNAGVVQQIAKQNSHFLDTESFMVVVDRNLIRLADGLRPDLQFKTVVPLDIGVLSALQAERRMPLGAPDELSTNLPALAEGLKNSGAAPNFTAELHPEGDSPHTVAVSQMTQQPWYVVFAVSQTVVLAPVRDQYRVNILVLLVSALLVSAIALGVAQILSGPITRLTNVAGLVASGNLQARAQVEADDEIGTLATTFNAMTGQLRETLAGLEQRVAERTQALAASAEVSRRLSTILDRHQLIREVVEQVQQAFNYYHVHIYLFDEERENLIMAGGTGEAGQTLLARGHKIPRGRGLVGRAAETNTVVLVSNVAQAPGWLPNPLLPDTQAEVAVPITAGDLVLGVLDVQHNVVGGLAANDADLIQSIANQVAIALQNIRAYERTEQQASFEALVNTITQRIQDTTTPASAMQVAVREVGRALGAQQTRVRLKIAPTDAPQPDNGAG